MGTDYAKLSRREREIMDVLYEREEATAAEVQAALADPPSYSAVRATLRILEEKGAIAHRRDGRRYVFAYGDAADGAGRAVRPAPEKR